MDMTACLQCAVSFTKTRNNGTDCRALGMAVGVGHSQFSRDVAVQGFLAFGSSLPCPEVLGRGRNLHKYHGQVLSGQEKAWFQRADWPSQAVCTGACSCQLSSQGGLSPDPTAQEGAPRTQS